jgi:hypothetical protein
MSEPIPSVDRSVGIQSGARQVRAVVRVGVRALKCDGRGPVKSGAELANETALRDIFACKWEDGR